MSDIPELDKIIEENHNYRFNKKMRNQTRLFNYILYFLISFLFVFLIGIFSKFLSLLFGFLSVLFFIKFIIKFKDDDFDLHKRYSYR